MDNKIGYSITEAAEKLGVGAQTIRRRVLDKTIKAEYPSRKLGYRISEEELNKYAESIKDNPRIGKGRSATKKANNAKDKAKANKRTAATRKEVKATSEVKSEVKSETKANAKTGATATKRGGARGARKAAAQSAPKLQSLETNLPKYEDETKMELVLGNSFGTALSAIVSACASMGDLNMSKAKVNSLIEQLSNPVVLEKIIERLRVEQEYFDIQISSQELKIKELPKNADKRAEQEKLIDLKFKRNQIGKDLTDLEIRKALL